jgi:hypothetical protein
MSASCDYRILSAFQANITFESEECSLLTLRVKIALSSPNPIVVASPNETKFLHNKPKLLTLIYRPACPPLIALIESLTLIVEKSPASCFLVSPWIRSFLAAMNCYQQRRSFSDWLGV